MAKLSREFVDLNLAVGNLIESHPRGGYVPYLKYSSLHADPRPELPFRIQLSANGEGGIGITDTETGIEMVGRISVTGVMDTPLTPLEGWHFFDIGFDGSVMQLEIPSDRSEVPPKKLDDEEIAILVAWLEKNRDVLLEN